MASPSEDDTKNSANDEPTTPSNGGPPPSEEEEEEEEASQKTQSASLQKVDHDLPTVEKLRQAGNDLFKRGQPLAAVEKYSDALAIEPSNHLLLSNRSLAYHSAKMHTEAITDARECVRLAPDFVKGYYRLATAQLGLGLHDEAVDAVRRGLDREADNPELKKLTRIINKAKKDAATLKTRQNRPDEPDATKNKGSARDASLSGNQQQRPPVTGGLTERQREFADVARRIRRTEAEKADMTARGQAYNRDLARTRLTQTQVYELPDDAQVYRSVGKIFLESSKTEALKQLKDQTDAADDKLAGITANLGRLQMRLETEQDELNALSGRLPGIADAAQTPPPPAAAAA